MQSISAYSVTRVTSTDPYYSSTTSLRQRSSSSEGSVCSDFLPSSEEMVVRVRVENSEEMLTNSVTVDKVCEAKNEIVGKESAEND